MTSLTEALEHEPFELILSSGFFGFHAHVGVVAALEEAGLVPALVGGASAGALVSAMWAAGLSAAQMRERLFALRRSDFWDPDPLLGLPATTRPGLLRGRRFSALIEGALTSVGARNFHECRFPVRVVAWDIALRRCVVLSQGALEPAIRASCAVPALFQPVVIDGRGYYDGGISDRAGIGAASSEHSAVLFHHLPVRAPWSVIDPSENHPPVRRGKLHMLFEPKLPRMSPFHLSRGPRAYELARTMTRRALASPI